MNLINAKEISWKPDSLEEVKASATAIIPTASNQETLTAQADDVSAGENTSVFGKMKAFVRKAVDCCIE